MANWYTSDWHLNETRIKAFNPFFRPFDSIEEQNEVIISTCNRFVKEDDTLYHLGDVSIDLDGIKLLDKLNAKKRILIVGNYDEDKLPELSKYFDDVQMRMTVNIGGQDYRLNHYPASADKNVMNIVGHIHGLWKVQPGMINVGVDAWHFRPLDDNTIQFVTTAIEKYYDANVFPTVPDLKTIQSGMSADDFKTWRAL